MLLFSFLFFSLFLLCFVLYRFHWCLFKFPNLYWNIYQPLNQFSVFFTLVIFVFFSGSLIWLVLISSWSPFNFLIVYIVITVLKFYLLFLKSVSSVTTPSPVWILSTLIFSPFGWFFLSSGNFLILMLWSVLSCTLYGDTANLCSYLSARFSPLWYSVLWTLSWTFLGLSALSPQLRESVWFSHHTMV